MVRPWKVKTMEILLNSKDIETVYVETVYKIDNIKIDNFEINLTFKETFYDGPDIPSEIEIVDLVYTTSEPSQKVREQIEHELLMHLVKNINELVENT